MQDFGTAPSWIYLVVAVVMPFAVEGIKALFERLPRRWVPVVATALPEALNLLILMHVPLDGVYPGLGAGAGLLAIGLREVSIKSVMGQEKGTIIDMAEANSEIERLRAEVRTLIHKPIDYEKDTL
jgi:hypothetical protein